MKKLTLTDDIDFIKKYIPKAIEGTFFFMLKEDEGALRIQEYLSETLRIKAITRREIRDNLGKDFKSQFSKAIRSVNRSNGSVDWWAMNFTNKNPILSRLCEDAFCFAAIIELFADYKDLDLIVITNKTQLVRQLGVWSKENGIDFLCKISFRMDISSFLRHNTPLVILYMFFKLLLRKITSRILLKGPDYLASQSVIFSEFDNRSIDPENFYREIYFKDLKKALNECYGMNDISFLTVGVSPYFGPLRFYDFCRSLKQKEENADIYPIEHFLPIRDLIKHLFTSLARVIIPERLKGSFKIFGEEASGLLQYEINKSISSGQMLMNLSIHAAMSAFSKRYKPQIVYYPFENRSWEKMAVMACRDQSEKTKLVGYQHTIITPKHLCYYLEEGEHTEIPLPDAIITVGEVPRDIMRQWNFPADMLKIGCALRVLTHQEKLQPRKRAIKEILVALAVGRDEYVKMLIFLENAFAATGRYDIILRPHPVIPLNAALEIFKPKHLKYRVSMAPLEEDIELCDLVLYASSTVSIEAISMGKPAIFIELDDFFNSDPMFDMEMLKWRCGSAARLKELIDTIDEMSEEAFCGMREKAFSYTKRYFYPVNRKNLAAFLS